MKRFFSAVFYFGLGFFGEFVARIAWALMGFPKVYSQMQLQLCKPPWFYGEGIRDFTKRVVIYYPVPLNKLVSFLSWAHEWLRYRGYEREKEKARISELLENTASLQAVITSQREAMEDLAVLMQGELTYFLYHKPRYCGTAEWAPRITRFSDSGDRQIGELPEAILALAGEDLIVFQAWPVVPGKIFEDVS